MSIGHAVRVKCHAKGHRLFIGINNQGNVILIIIHLSRDNVLHCPTAIHQTFDNFLRIRK